MTAPAPPRPAARCSSFMTQASRTCFSPAGPMHETLMSSSPNSARMASCVWSESRPQMRRGVADLDLAVVDPQVDRGVGLAFDDQAVVARQLEVASPPAGRTGGQPHVRERRLGAHLVAGGGGERGAGQRTGHEDQLVRRAQRIGVARHLIVDDPRPVAGPADESARRFLVEWIFPDGPPGQVDPQELPHVTEHAHLNSTLRAERTAVAAPRRDAATKYRAFVYGFSGVSFCCTVTGLLFGLLTMTMSNMYLPVPLIHWPP